MKNKISDRFIWTVEMLDIDPKDCKKNLSTQWNVLSLLSSIMGKSNDA